MQLVNLQGMKMGDEYNPCSCCGMTYRAPTQPVKRIQSAGKGIRVIYGEHGRERDTGTVFIKHVQTKNGILTVVNKVK